MKGKIERTSFWFKDKEEKLLSLDDSFFGLSILLNRLLNEKYEGNRIKIINLYFYTEETYEMFPQLKKKYTHYYNGHLAHYDLFELSKFNKLNAKERSDFIWSLSCESLKRAAKSKKNNSLLESVVYAYEEGLENNLIPDYKMVENVIVLYGEKLKAAVWVNFKEGGMYSKFTLEKGNRVIFEKPIDTTKNGVEYFLEIYKSIDVIGDSIIIKGDRDIDYLPLKIDLDKSLIIGNQ